MSQSRSALPALLTFVFGAAVGALVVCLSTAKRRPHLRRRLKNLTQLRRQRSSRRTYGWHAAGPKRGFQVSLGDLPG